jgi:hypothetical protein
VPNVLLVGSLQEGLNIPQRADDSFVICFYFNVNKVGMARIRVKDGLNMPLLPIDPFYT